jgi:hypothetical protein
MSGVFDRVSKVAKAEWSHLVRSRRDKDDTVASPDDRAPPRPSTSGLRRPSVPDVDAALRVLELERGATLDVVRARYRDMARRYQPKTQSPQADDRDAAQTLMLALTDALEILEEHLLPLP